MPPNLLFSLQKTTHFTFSLLSLIVPQTLHITFYQLPLRTTLITPHLALYTAHIHPLFFSNGCKCIRQVLLIPNITTNAIKYADFTLGALYSFFTALRHFTTTTYLYSITAYLQHTKNTKKSSKKPKKAQKTPHTAIFLTYHLRWPHPVKIYNGNLPRYLGVNLHPRQLPLHLSDNPLP